MMRFLLLPAFVGISLNAAAQNTINQTDSLNRRQGYWVFYGKDRPELNIPPNGKVEEGYYVNDRKEGMWIKYHEDGITPKLKGNYENNRPKGPYIKTGPWNNIRETGSFSKNHYQDSIKRFYDNGQLEYEAFYNENGKEEGQVNFYYESGQPEHTYFAINGVPHNICHLDISGNIIYESAGPTICNYPPEKPVSKKQATEYPMPVNPETPNTREILFKPDAYNKVYNSDNEIWQDGIFKNGQLWEGKLYIYDEDGILLKVRIYKDGAYQYDGQL